MVYDEIVIGGGLAGATAAIAAKEGCDVKAVDTDKLRDILRKDGAVLELFPGKSL